MSTRLSPDAALILIPQLRGKKFQWTALPGGLTNRSFKVETTGESLVLRLDDVHTASLGLDRVAELKVRNAASSAGIGARVVYSDSGRGILLSEFLNGRVWQAADLDSDRNLIALAGLLHKVHALPLTGERYDAAIAAARYARAVTADSGLRDFAETCVRVINETSASIEMCCCHNDIVVGNVVEHDGLMLLDWEYSCDNDPMFDLASVIAYHDLDERQINVLFGAYAGSDNQRMRKTLSDQIRVFDAIQWLWFAVKQGTNAGEDRTKRLDELRHRIVSAN